MRNYPYGFENYLVNVKTIRKIAQIFVTFSEKLNFKSIENNPPEKMPLNRMASLLIDS